MWVFGYVSFEGNVFVVLIVIGLDVINVEFDKKVSWYDVEVVVNVGVYFDMYKLMLVWDVKFDKWINVSWEEGKFIWGYDIVNRGNDL